MKFSYSERYKVRMAPVFPGIGTGAIYSLALSIQCSKSSSLNVAHVATWGSWLVVRGVCVCVCMHVWVCRYSTGTESLSCPGSHREQQSQPGPPANDQLAVLYLWACLWRTGLQWKSEELHPSSSPHARCPPWQPSGPVLVHQLHNTCATLRLSGVQLLQGLLPLGDGITDLQGAKEQG